MKIIILPFLLLLGLFGGATTFAELRPYDLRSGVIYGPIWSDGTNLWAAYKLGGSISVRGVRSVPNGPLFPLHKDNRSAAGIWSDGVTMWVADRSDARIYAYDMETKVRDMTKEFSSSLQSAGNTSPGGIWSDGATMWVTDVLGARIIYAYNMQTKARDIFKELPLAGNIEPLDLWSDGTTMWVGVTVPGDSKIYAYGMQTKLRDRAKEFDLHFNGWAGIWSNGELM